MTADGYSLDDKRNKIADNDIPDIITQYRQKDKDGYKQTKKHFFIDVADIKANDYDLSINRYKEIEYSEVEYPPTQEIFDDIKTLNIEITSDLQILQQILG
jgi:type I restriction enzyme M protein